ncbi:MAG: efflux RND transporter permease subunit [Polyangia bacterium]
MALNPDHRTSSYDYMARVRKVIQRELPQLSIYMQSGGMIDAVLNQGVPAPIDVQVSGSDLNAAFSAAAQLAGNFRRLPGVSDVFIPQDLDYPSLMLDVDRQRAGELGLTQQEIVDNVITALTSNGMVAPSYWIDPKSGNDYMLTVQYPEDAIKSLFDLRALPLRSPYASAPSLLDAVTRVTPFTSPTEIDHYQIQRVLDVYVNTTTEDLGHVAAGVRKAVAAIDLPEGLRVDVRGMVQGMEASFKSFGLGLLLSLVLLYLILVAQFRSFVDPFLILLAVPTGAMGVLLTLVLTGTTLNVMSLMGIIMMVGIGVLDRALQNRPELSALRLEVNAAQSFAKAERDLWFPSVSAIGAAGLIPYRESELDSRYAAAGFNVNIPIFNGFLFNARRAAAVERARAQEQILRDTQNNIVRDAQKAWLDATSGYQRLSVTEQLVEEASKALDLARERYQMGLGSIVELSQAELNETEAEIARTNARYDYQGQFAALNYQMGLLR